MKNEQDYNPRFVAFAAAHGKTAAEARAECMARPVGRMMPFILWINSKWTEWRKLNGREPMSSLSPADHANFDLWLNAGAQP